MPFGPSRQNANLVAYIVLAFGVAIAVGVGYHQLKKEARERIEVVNQVSLEHCREDEKIKAELRRKAWVDYNRLDETLILLGIEKTPAIENRAKQERDYTLENFKAERCPRKVIHQ